MYIKEINAIFKNGFRNLLDESVRPNLFFYNDGFPTCYGYWLKGTGFFIRYGNHLIYLTARHNFLKNDIFSNYSDFQYNNLILLKQLNKKQDIKYKNTHVDIDNIFINSVNPDYSSQYGHLCSSDISDIAIITINEKLKHNLPYLDYKEHFFYSERKGNTFVAKNNDFLFIAGHPHEKNTYEYIYDNEKNYAELLLQRCYLTGKCVENKDGIGIISIINDNNIADYNGFSGSPIFVYNNENDTYELTGMFIRGSSLSKRGYFISINYIYLNIMNTDINTMRLELDISNKKKQEIIRHLKELEIGEIKYNKNKIFINRKDETITVNFKYEYSIKPLLILSKNSDLIKEENLYILQEIIVKSKFNLEVEKLLYEIDYNDDKLNQIKALLIDDEYICEDSPLLDIAKVKEKLIELV